MMEGITILSQGAGCDLKTWGIIYLILFSIDIILSVVLGVICIKVQLYKESIGCGAMLILGILGLVVLAIPSFKAGSITQYKVTISEEVKFKEFNEKYEIVDQDGEIYKIVEKDNG